MSLKTIIILVFISQMICGYLALRTHKKLKQKYIDANFEAEKYKSFFYYHCDVVRQKERKIESLQDQYKELDKLCTEYKRHCFKRIK